jgi:2-dehydropantoate 2-reductase
MTDVDDRIAVVGAGAIGTSVAADLTEAQLDVTVIDQWPAHVEAMKKGVRVEMPGHTVEVAIDAYHLHEVSSLHRAFDVAFLAVKSNDTRWMTELIRPHLAANGVLVALQNGMNNADIAEIVGADRTIGSVVELSAEIFEPGIVQRDTDRERTWFAIGELDGLATPRLEHVQRIMRHVARVDISEDIEGAKWTKLVVNSMTMGPFGLFGLKNWDAMDLPGMLDISVKIGREAIAVGEAAGYRLNPIFGMPAKEFAGATDEVLVNAMRTLMAHIGRNSSTAPVHDHKKGRTSEMRYITGAIVERGRELGVPTPCNEAVLEIDDAINRGERPMDVSNFELLKERIGARES